MGIAEWRQQLSKGEVSARELTDHHLQRISAVDPSVHAFLEVTQDRARADANADDDADADARAAAEERAVEEASGVPSDGGRGDM